MFAMQKLAKMLKKIVLFFCERIFRLNCGIFWT